ncbi:DUF4389 domain-containing protein [Arthrobacter sp.]|uniref:DUF4389 domain-containing protein n=1 Tax=Arthrobacter sp. TaxID=1667 RepID=UPI00339B6309
MTAQPAPSYAPPPGPPRARMKPGNWVLLILGVLLSTLGIGMTIAGSIVLGAAAAQSGGYLTGGTKQYQGTGYALTSPSVVVDPWSEGMPPVGDLASVQVRAEAVVPDQEVFVGIAKASDVQAYLRDVPVTPLSGASWSQSGEGQMSWRDRDRTTPGNRAPAAPAEQDFWTESATGSGAQTISWEVQPGQWSLVVMNADASRPVWVDLQAGARSDLLGPIGSGLLIPGIIAVVIGIPLLLLGSAGLGRNIDLAGPRPGQGPGATLAGNAGWERTPASVYPVRLAGYLDSRLSRGLWLVKWLLAIPHYIVLALLWFALVVSTIAAGIVILFTGRYPRSWFCFNVGVLRWSWRVGFYGYSALGTDRYPPFTLATAEYPAELDVAYPQRLSHGLVLVKWWLLAIPHLLIVGIFTSGSGLVWSRSWGDGASVSSWGLSLLGVLILITAVILLFTARYPYEIFAFVMGLNRWSYRLAAYVLLMRDEYPPFRLDQGADEPPAAAPSEGPPRPGAPGTAAGNGTPEPGKTPGAARPGPGTVGPEAAPGAGGPGTAPGAPGPWPAAPGPDADGSGAAPGSSAPGPGADPGGPGPAR